MRVTQDTIHPCRTLPIRHPNLAAHLSVLGVASSAKVANQPSTPPPPSTHPLLLLDPSLPSHHDIIPAATPIFTKPPSSSYQSDRTHQKPFTETLVSPVNRPPPPSVTQNHTTTATKTSHTPPSDVNPHHHHQHKTNQHKSTTHLSVVWPRSSSSPLVAEPSASHSITASTSC